MAEIETKTTKVGAEAIPVVKSGMYQNANVTRVVVGKLVQVTTNGESEPVFPLSFLRMQAVPMGTAADLDVKMEESALATFVLDREQAEKLVKLLGDRLADVD